MRPGRELERDRGERLIERLGSLDVGPVAADVGRALAARGVVYETLTSAEAESRWPIRLDADETAVFQADGGFLHAERAHAALLATAMERGVEVRAGTPVRELTLESGAVRLTLDRGELLTRAVVVTAGAWAPTLLSSAGIGLTVVPTCETVVYLDLPTAEVIPPVIDYGRLPSAEQTGISRVGQAAYALPAPGRGLKAGLHHSGPAVDPDGRHATDERVAAWVEAWASDRYDGVGQVLATETCLYTNTADEGFVLERHGRVVVGSACSGHGFKFAPVVGRTLAALAREAAA